MMAGSCLYVVLGLLLSALAPNDLLQPVAEGGASGKRGAAETEQAPLASQPVSRHEVPIVYNYRFGHPPLSNKQVEEWLARAEPHCPKGQKVWFIYVTANWQGSMPNRAVGDVFFTPQEQTRRMRKGVYVHFTDARLYWVGADAPEGATEAQVVQHPAQKYVQVSSRGKPFDDKNAVPDVAALPFPRPDGFTENEIVEIVDFARTDPCQPGTSRSSGDRQPFLYSVGCFDGAVPIISMDRRDDAIEIRSGAIQAPLAGSGQVLECRRNDDGSFEVLSVGHWVS